MKFSGVLKSKEKTKALKAAFPHTIPVFMFFITLLDHGYWVLGSALGGLLGYMVSFNTKGLDFVLTALFVVIFIGQWKTQKNHKPAVIGVVCSIVCLVVFGQSNFIIPSMIARLAVLTVFRKKLAGVGVQ